MMNPAMPRFAYATIVARVSPPSGSMRMLYR